MAAAEHPDRSVVDQVCVAAVDLLALSGAGISLIVDSELRGSTGVTGPAMAMLQELELTLGEGPSTTAWASRRPVSEADLGSSGASRWPAFARAATQTGVRAVFAVPLDVGGIRLGVLLLSRDATGLLTGEEMAMALVLAQTATMLILDLQSGAIDGDVHTTLAHEPGHWAEIHQAAGMISVQLDVSLDEAFVRLRAHAFASDAPLRTVARDVVSRRLHLDADT
jgi:ANTAR domain